MNTEAEPAPVRAFIGIHARPRPVIRDALGRLGSFGRSVRPTREGQLHLTLKFLGDVAGERIPALVSETTRIAAATPAFEWVPQGIGAFPSTARPSVIWAGTTEPDRFASLAEQFESACGLLGFPREGRPYRPHLTLARVKFQPPPSLGRWLTETAEAEFDRQRAEEIVLYRSEPTPDGFAYTPLHVAKLGGETSDA